MSFMIFYAYMFAIVNIGHKVWCSILNYLKLHMCPILHYLKLLPKTCCPKKTRRQKKGDLKLIGALFYIICWRCSKCGGMWEAHSGCFNFVMSDLMCKFWHLNQLKWFSVWERCMPHFFFHPKWQSESGLWLYLAWLAPSRLAPSGIIVVI
jgi:hypothetical protein